MKWFVYYCDGYFDDGDVGFEEFDDELDAIKFIEERIAMNKSSTENYKVVQGFLKNIEPVEVVSKVKIS